MKTKELMVESIRQRVAVKALIPDADNRILILKQSDHVLNAGNGGFWDFPGGKIKPGESIRDGLTREVFEESQLKVELTDSHHPIYVDQWMPTVNGVRTQITALFYVCTNVRKESIQLAQQHTAYHWLAENKINQFNLFSEPYAALRIYYSKVQ